MDQVPIRDYPLLNAYVFGAFEESSGLGYTKFERLRLTTDRMWAMDAEKELKEAGLMWTGAYDAGYWDTSLPDGEYAGKYPRANHVAEGYF